MCCCKLAGAELTAWHWRCGEQKHVDKVDVQLLSLAEVFEEAFEKIQAGVQVRETDGRTDGTRGPAAAEAPSEGGGVGWGGVGVGVGGGGSRMLGWALPKSSHMLTYCRRCGYCSSESLLLFGR